MGDGEPESKDTENQRGTKMIEFYIPGGKMTIDLDVFLRAASTNQIKKMLKYLSQSRSHEEQVQEIRVWLEREIRYEKYACKRSMELYDGSSARLIELKSRYDVMRNPISTVCVRDKTKLSEIKKNIQIFRSAIARHKKEGEEAKRLTDRCEKILATMDKMSM